MIDDRVCMHYVVDRLEDIMGSYDPNDHDKTDLKYMYQSVLKKTELKWIDIYLFQIK